jgi:hypothetical protein
LQSFGKDASLARKGGNINQTRLASDGLKDLPPIHKRHPGAMSPETVETTKALPLKHPACGWNRPEAMPALEGITSPAVSRRSAASRAMRTPAKPGLHDPTGSASTGPTGSRD